MRQAKNPFHELIETAILGTDRKPLNVILSGGDLGNTIADIGRQELPSERLLIDQLTAISIAKKAGLIPGSFTCAPPVCPAEIKAKVSERSLSLLIQVLTLEAKGSELKHFKIISEWLELCNTAQQRLPEEFVPRLLDWGRTLTEMHQLIGICCGQHFDWLLSLNEEWRAAYISKQNIDKENLIETFETGEQKERLMAFSAIRNTWPDEGLSLLALSFEKESFENKVAFLKILSKTLHSNDEGFLESTLKDRRKEVRAQAANALSALPNSKLQMRMIERADRFLTYKQNKIIVTLPEELDDEMLRDGIVENSPIYFDSRLGTKANWLCQILSLVPPSHFEQKFNLSAKALLEAALANSEWSLALSLALMAAAAKFGGAMQQALLQSEDLNITDSQAGLLLLKALPQATLENLILQKLPTWSQARTISKAAPRLDLWYYLEQVDFNWSEHFTGEIMKFIIKESREKVPVFGHTFYSNASNFALRMHIVAGELTDQINVDADTADIYRRNALERMTDTVKLRYEIFQSFNTVNHNEQKGPMP